MNKYTIKQTFIFSLVILFISLLIDTFILQKTILSKGLGIVFPGYLGSVVFSYKKRYLHAAFWGFMLGIILEALFFVLVLVGIIPVPEQIGTVLSTISPAKRIFVYTAATCILGVIFAVYAILGAVGAKIFWKSKGETQK